MRRYAVLLQMVVFLGWARSESTTTHIAATMPPECGTSATDIFMALLEVVRKANSVNMFLLEALMIDRLAITFKTSMFILNFQFQSLSRKSVVRALKEHCNVVSQLEIIPKMVVFQSDSTTSQITCHASELLVQTIVGLHVHQNTIATPATCRA